MTRLPSLPACFDKNVSSAQSKTLWLDTCEPLIFSPLNQDMVVDTVIIGAGIAGISIAYRLAKEGKSVAVVEDGYVGSGETGRTSAHLTWALDDRFFHLEKFHGAEMARQCIQSHKAAIDFVEQAVQDERIHCDFKRVDGYLLQGIEDDQSILEKELETLHSLGASEVSMIASAPAFESGPCLRFPQQAQFHPLKYLEGLCAAIIGYGGKIFTTTHAKSIEKNSITTTAGFTINASNVVIATNPPVTDIRIATKQAPYRTYVSVYNIGKDTVEEALYWDTDEHGPPYHYVRVYKTPKQDYLIVGGEDHKTAQADDFSRRYSALQTWAKKRFPIGKLMYSWSGQIMEPSDSVAYIGRYKEDTMYVASGDSGNGLTHGTIAGILIPDLILGRENEWESLYDPHRTSKSIKEFIKENANVTKELLSGYVERGDARALRKEQGTVVTRGVQKIALFKDTKGHVHEFSAVCPHMKCIVKWNSAEKSFDCPCHGSRFTCMGKVVMGPANSDLEPIYADKDAARIAKKQTFGIGESKREEATA